MLCFEKIDKIYRFTMIVVIMNKVLQGPNFNYIYAEISYPGQY